MKTRRKPLWDGKQAASRDILLMREFNPGKQINRLNEQECLSGGD